MQRKDPKKGENMEERTESLVKNNTAGNSDSISRACLDSLLFEERLIGSKEADTSTELFGKKLTTPIMTAALSGFERYGAEADVNTARAVKRIGSIMWMGISEDAAIERVAATGVNLIEIIKPYADKDIIYRKIENDKRLGLTAIGMDIDHCFDKKTGHIGSDRNGFPMEAKTVGQLREYKKACEGIPFIVKGVLSVRDAAAAAEAGADAIVISHHHNIYPYAVPPVQLLPQIRRELGDEFTIITDSNLNDGYDCAKALLLGSDGVCIGRALLLQITKGGEDGIYNLLSEMTDQLRCILSRTGTASLKGKDPGVIHRK